MTLPDMPAKAEQDYYRLISKIESNDNPKAKAKTSSASGRFQFIKSTWEGLGYNWADVFDDKKQWEAIEKFTAQNAAKLKAAGCAINFATLYGAHFLGVAGFLRVMRGLPGDSISTVTTAAQRKANPTILNGTIRDFTDWLKRKTGDDYTKRYTETGWVSGDKVVVPPVEEKSGNPLAAIIFVVIAIAVVVAIAILR